MEIAAARQMMKLLYGAERTNCFRCRCPLSDPEKAHPKTHPTIKFKTIALCNSCNLESPTISASSSSGSLSINTPKEYVRCSYCHQKFLDEFGELEGMNPIYCSQTCRYLQILPESPAKPSEKPTFKRAASWKTAGPCDCEDYYESGVCTMVFKCDDERNTIFEPR